MKNYALLYLVFALVLGIMFVSCEKKSDIQVELPQTAPSGLDSILPTGAKLEKITAGYTFDTAGSPLYVDGDIYFTNNNLTEPVKSCTVKMDASGNYTLLRENNGVVTKLLNSGKGTIYACEMFDHRIVEMDKSGKILRVVCGEYNGKRIDGPNDFIIDRKGGIFFTDSQFIGEQPKVQDKPAVYYIRPDGSVIRVIDDIEFPNGIGLSPDEKTLYIANTRQKYLLAYDVLPDGTTANGRNFAEHQLSEKNIAEGNPTGGADGFVVDSAGNIFVATTQGLGIQVYDSKGNHLGNIPCETATNNCTFGGPDMKTLYVSALDGIYMITLKIPGLKQPQE